MEQASQTSISVRMVADCIFESQRLPADGTQTPLYFEQLAFLLRRQHGRLRVSAVFPFLPRPLRGQRSNLLGQELIKAEIVHTFPSEPSGCLAVDSVT
jgi:hypothetical protein